MTTQYTIHTKSNGELHIPFNTGDPNNWTRGERHSFTFEFPAFLDSLTVSEDYTIGSVEGYTSVTVESEATLTIKPGGVLHATAIENNGEIDNNGLIANDDTTDRLLDVWMEYAGSYTTQTTLNNTERYTLQIPTNLVIDTLVVGIEPSQELKDNGVVGIWGLIDRVQNNRNAPLTTNRYQLSVYGLAPFDEYADVSAVENDLEI